MKYILLFIFTLMVSWAKSQNSPDSIKPDSIVKSGNDEDPKIFTHSEVSPSYPGGEKKLKVYLEKNLNYQIALDKGAPKGKYKIVIQFVVRKDGSAYDFTAQTTCGFGMEDEVIRVLKQIQGWEPARQNKRKVYAYCKVHVAFNL